MKKIVMASIFISGALFPTAQFDIKSGTECDPGVKLNESYSKATVLDSVMKHYTTNALPGVSLAIYSEKEGWWAGAQGYANVEKKVPMQNCHLQYLQSISKS